MSWTKREILADVFGELALAGYTFDINPEELQAALRKLDLMMATWSAQGINIGYAFGLTPSGTDLDQDSGLPLFAVEAVVQGAAIRLAASKGKAVASSSKAVAKAAWDAMVLVLAQSQAQEQQLPSTTPIGAGNKPFRQSSGPFMPLPDEDAIGVGGDGGLTFNGT